jgi:hypothetical protein
MKSLSPSVPCSQEPFHLIETIDSIYPISTHGLLFFLSYKKTGSLVGAYVGVAFVFLARLEFHVLILEIERWFSYFPSVVSKSLKSYHASNNDYCTLEASSTFWQKKFSLLFYLGILHVGCYRSQSSQVPSNETVKSL